MPGPGRNDPCPCGSGRKVKRCCQQQRGPSEEQLARAASRCSHATSPTYPTTRSTISGTGSSISPRPT